MDKKTKNKAKNFANRAWSIASVSTGILIATATPAFAEEGGAIDLTTGLGAVAVIGGLMASGTLKALPTYTAWGIRKALSMLR